MRVTRTKNGARVETTGHVWDGDLAEYNNPLPRWWMWLFYATIVFSLGYLVLYPGLGRAPGTLGWTSAGAYASEVKAQDEKVQPLYAKYRAMDVKAVAADAEARAMGERLFLNYCAQCHGSDAGGSKGFPNLRDADWLGVQRHLKILGIFARLHYRDGKSKYLPDAPRFIAYLDDVLPLYAELSPLRDLLDTRIRPAMERVA